jgi:hypothetical protein
MRNRKINVPSQEEKKYMKDRPVTPQNCRVPPPKALMISLQRPALLDQTMHQPLRNPDTRRRKLTTAAGLEKEVKLKGQKFLLKQMFDLILMGKPKTNKPQESEEEVTTKPRRVI